MKTITVRGIDESLSKELKRAAKAEGKSVNQVVIESIRSRLGKGNEKRFTAVYHDLDHLFGKWSQEDFDAIQGKIDSERKIDREIWE
jgi:plasmid stability protein